MPAPRYIHPACKTTLWKKNGEWWCPKCRTWVPDKILEPQRQAEIDEGLRALMPKLMPSHLDGKNDERVRFVAVLEIPPVDSAKRTVQVQIVKDVKANKK